MKIKINYLYNSGFTLETKNHFLVFDYFEDPNCIITEELIKSKNNILVFSSHSHHDHYNPVILSWERLNPNVQYILSSDIIIKQRPNYYNLSSFEEVNIDRLFVKAYGSTDIGVSFLIKIDEITIFHAGDLNWWHWKEDTAEEKSYAERFFKEEVEKIVGEKIDICFFPIDPRLQEYYYIGGKQFIEKLKPKYFIPMHFGNNFNITKEFLNKINEFNTKILEISCTGQEIIIEI